MAQAERRIFSGIQATSRLDELGLTPAALRDAVETAWTNHAVYVTGFEPLNSQGSILYFKTVGGLRQKTKKLGYEAFRTSDGYELTVHSELKIAIAVALGNEDTGTGLEPSTKRPKGEATRQAVDVNQLCWDFGDMKRMQSQFPGFETWLLLVCPDLDKEEIRLELSLPARMVNKYVTKWGPRIILDPISLAEPVEVEAAPETDSDVEVKRRAK